MSDIFFLQFIPHISYFRLSGFLGFNSGSSNQTIIQTWKNPLNSNSERENAVLRRYLGDKPRIIISSPVAHVKKYLGSSCSVAKTFPKIPQNKTSAYFDSNRMPDNHTSTELETKFRRKNPRVVRHFDITVNFQNRTIKGVTSEVSQYGATVVIESDDYYYLQNNSWQNKPHVTVATILNNFEGELNSVSIDTSHRFIIGVKLSDNRSWYK